MKFECFGDLLPHKLSILFRKYGCQVGTLNPCREKLAGDLPSWCVREQKVLESRDVDIIVLVKLYAL